MSKAWMVSLAAAICARLGVAQDPEESPIVFQIAGMIEQETAYQIRELRHAAQRAMEIMPDGEARNELERAVQAFSDV